MAIIKVGRRHINPAYVAEMQIEHRHYVNGSDAILTITMATGSTFSIMHEPHLYDGADIYKIEREIKAAMAAKPELETKGE